MLDAPETASRDGGFRCAFRYDGRRGLGVQTEGGGGAEGSEKALEEAGHGGGHEDEECD